MDSMRRLSGGLFTNLKIEELEPCQKQWFTAHIEITADQTIIRGENIGLWQLAAMLEWLEQAKAWVYYCSHMHATFIERMNRDREFVYSEIVVRQTQISRSGHRRGTDAHKYLSGATFTWKHIGDILSSLEESLRQLEVYLVVMRSSNYPHMIPLDLMQRIGKLTNMLSNWSPPSMRFQITSMVVASNSDEIDSLRQTIQSQPYKQSDAAKIYDAPRSSSVQTSSTYEPRSTVTCTIQRTARTPLRHTTVFVYEPEETLIAKLGKLSDLVKHAITEAKELVRLGEGLLERAEYPSFI